MNENFEVVTAAAKPVRKAAKGKSTKRDALFCLGIGDAAPDGSITLSAPVSEETALAQSYKKEVCFYRVEKLRAECNASTGMKMVAVPEK